MTHRLSLLIKQKAHAYLKHFHNWLGFHLLPQKDRQLILRAQKKGGVKPTLNEGPLFIPFAKSAPNPTSLLSDYEIQIMANFIPESATVFDIGAFHGEWAITCASLIPNIKAHLFEASPANAAIVSQKVSQSIASENTFVNPCAVSHFHGLLDLHLYEGAPSWNSAYRRKSIEAQGRIPHPEHLRVPCLSIDSYCQEQRIEHVHYLKIDVEGAEFDVLKGCSRMLESGMIDMFQFEYGGTFDDAGISLAEVHSYLTGYNYILFIPTQTGIVELEHTKLPGTGNKLDIFVCHRRFLPVLLKKPYTPESIISFCARKGISVKGVIHVGAHEGNEALAYLNSSATSIKLVDANPTMVNVLKSKFSRESKIEVIHSAISDYSGETIFHIANGDGQSSSLLPFKKHSEIYPSTKYESEIKVPVTTIDQLFYQDILNGSALNCLVLDIQGAELQALRGAVKSLEHFDVILSEVNFDALYEGGAHIWEIDRFLGQYGFSRFQIETPYHPSWGDAIYVKTSRIITMENFGKNGQFANQLFQIAFLSIYSQNHRCSFRIPLTEVVSYLQHRPQELHSPAGLPKWIEPSYLLPSNPQRFSFEDNALVGKDISGFFQLHSSQYVPYRNQFLQSIEVDSSFRMVMRKFLAVQMKTRNSATLIAIHIRRGDYGQGCFFRTPVAWFVEWLRQIWPQVDRPLLYIATDEPTIVEQFYDFGPVHSGILSPDMKEQAPDYLWDFLSLTHANALAISNSSYGFIASMAASQCRIFARASLPAGRLIPYDPWNAPVLFRECIEDYPQHQARD